VQATICRLLHSEQEVLYQRARWNNTERYRTQRIGFLNPGSAECHALGDSENNARQVQDWRSDIIGSKVLTACTFHRCAERWRGGAHLYRRRPARWSRRRNPADQLYQKRTEPHHTSTTSQQQQAGWHASCTIGLVTCQLICYCTLHIQDLISADSGDRADGRRQYRHLPAWSRRACVRQTDLWASTRQAAGSVSAEVELDVAVDSRHVSCLRRGRAVGAPGAGS
jgi:hypothetical protein